MPFNMRWEHVRGKWAVSINGTVYAKHKSLAEAKCKAILNWRKQQ